MLARIITAIALAGGVALAIGVGEHQPPPVAVFVPAATNLTPPPAEPAPSSVMKIQATSCAADCQAQHDICRVRTKGSTQCDVERQICLQKCLQKKQR